MERPALTGHEGPLVNLTVLSALMKNFIVSQGAEPALMDPAEFGAHIKAESAKWARVIKAANVKPE